MKDGIYYLKPLTKENLCEIYQTSTSDTVLMKFKSIVKISDLFEKETVIIEPLSRCQVYIGSITGCFQLIWRSYTILLNDTFGLTGYYNPDFFQELRDTLCASVNQVSKKLRARANTFHQEWEYYESDIKTYLGSFESINNEEGFSNLCSFDGFNFFVKFIMEPEESLNEKAITIFTQVFNKYYSSFVSKDTVFKKIIDQYRFI